MGFTTIVLEKNETIVVFKQVPAQICDNCGEEYISSQTNREILEKANLEVNKGISLELLIFKASLTNVAYAN